MRIAYITAGAGAMYCGACARDVTVVRGLVGRGHEARMVPLYMPIQLDGDTLPPSSGIFFGGLTVYVRQILPGARIIPASLLRWLDHPRLLKWVARFAISVDPRSLGPMTVSMLAGRDGRQRAELDQLVEYLGREFRPDVVHLTNSMLSGLAPQLKARLGVPIVCTFQGEDSFIAAIPRPHHDRALELIRANARAIDLFTAPCDACAVAMRQFLAVAPDRICTIPTGIAAESFHRKIPRPTDPFTLGYLSGIKREKGLDLLIESLRLLAVRGRRIRLRIAGKILDPSYWKTIQRQIEQAGLAPHIEYVGELNFNAKVAFLHHCSAMAFPSRIPEWRGVAAMEAMAGGVPAILPYAGVFPELACNGGAILVPPENPTMLADAIVRLADHPADADAMAHTAAATIASRYTAAQMTAQTLAAYEPLISRPTNPGKPSPLCSE